MYKRFSSGQEATEFVLISILVFFSALLVVFIFGGKIANFFTNSSSAVKVTQNGSRAVDPTTGQKYEIQIDPYSGSKTTAGTSSVNLPGDSTGQDYGNLNVTQNADGSLTLDAAGQKVIVSPEIQSLADQIFQSSPTQTTATTGRTEVLKAISSLIEKHKSEYPEGQVPVSVTYGQASISYQDVEIKDSDGDTEETDPNVNGVAAASSVTVQVGNHIIIIQNDQCSVNDSVCQKYYPNQTRRFDGTVSADQKTLGGKMIVSNNSNQNEELTFNSNITINNGILNSFQTKISDKIGDMDSDEDTDIVMNFNKSFKL